MAVQPREPSPKFMMALDSSFIGTGSTGTDVFCEEGT
jgi:hypothetical protein